MTCLDCHKPLTHIPHAPKEDRPSEGSLMLCFSCPAWHVVETGSVRGIEQRDMRRIGFLGRRAALTVMMMYCANAVKAKVGKRR